MGVLLLLTVESEIKFNNFLRLAEMRVLDENDVKAGSGTKEVVTHPALLNDLVTYLYELE